MKHNHFYSVVVAGRRQAGFSVVDLTIWVVIVGVALALLLGLGPGIMNNLRVNAEASNLPAISACIQKYKFNKPNYAGTTTEQVISQGCFPENMTDGTTVLHRWTGAVTVAPVTVATSNDGLGITYENMPRNACTALVPTVAEYFLTVSVNGTAVKTVGQPVDDTALGTACNNNDNTVQWVLGK